MSGLFHGGENSLYDLEVFALHMMLNAVDAADQEKFLRQLSLLDLVQRSPNKKVVALFQANDTYFKSWGEVLLNDRSENLCAYQLELKDEVRLNCNLKLSVYFHQGRISSLEYKKVPEYTGAQKKEALSGVDWLHYNNVNTTVLKSNLFI